jgi:phosphoribosylamine--glycine ligase
LNILLIGSGGREHALAWAISASPLVSRLYCAPGNPGIAEVAECVPIGAMEFDDVVAFAQANRIDFVVIGPEAPLSAGLADRLEAAGIKALGPSAESARLESSKGFARDICAASGIPAPAYKRCANGRDAKAFAESLGYPVVVKADGLAQGKGVVIAESREEAVRAIDSMFAGAFGTAGDEVVIEEFLDGEEASLFALCDGEHILPLAGAQDHKRAFDGDTGPNTGGMGAYSPTPVLDARIEQDAVTRILQPVVRALRDRGTPYRGVLYAGLMITKTGPKLIEFNCRFGDPECQVLMPRLKSDLLPALIAARDGVLDSMDLRWRSETALCVVLASNGYPGAYATGSEIRGLERAREIEGVEIFHAGTVARDGKIVAAGGRVLDVCALGNDVAAAQDRAYRAIACIDWPEGFYRRDIGWRAIARKSSV